jgi:glycosyltransferase involved in cell wall biosynthesis
MSARPLSYTVVTPSWNEAANLPRLAHALATQARKPQAWIIVDNGSTDGTRTVAESLARVHPWIHVRTLAGAGRAGRGAPIVRALAAALESLDAPPDVLVNVDADVSMSRDYFSRLLAAFESNDTLGIASGSAHELRRGVWKRQHCTRGSVWGASRAYRWECLQAVLPLEERIGWDGIDELKANARGWTTRTLHDLPFLHHRREGERDGTRARRWVAQGELAHFMGYRLSYLFFRAIFRAATDPAALAMLAGYIGAAARRAPRCQDDGARSYLRAQQQLRRLPLRAREALGRAPASS